MSSELKPCPFCGRENIETEDGRAICMNCFVIAHERHWSDRPIEDALKEQIAKLQEDNRHLVEQMNAMANSLPQGLSSMPKTMKPPPG